MTTKMKRQTTYKILAAALCSALLIAGCQKDDTNVSVPHLANGVLSFGISQDGGWSGPSTKGEAPAPAVKGGSFRSEMLLMECDDPDSPLGEVYIYMVEEDIPEQQAAENLPATRAEGDPAEGEGTEVDSRTYGVFAYQGEGPVPETYVASDDVEEFADIQNLLIDATGKYAGQEIYAPGAGSWLYFYTYGPHMTLPAANDANPALRENGKYPYYEYTATPELAKTTDLLFGGSSAPQSGEVNEPVALSVSHILSKVKINSKDIGTGRITSIKLLNIKNSGTFNINNDGMWEHTADATADYGHTYIEEQEVVFDDLYLLPQELSDAAKIEIKVEVKVYDSDEEGNLTLNRTTEYTLTKQLNKFLKSWNPNKQYTYTISTPHEVEVEITDKVEYEGQHPVKRDLKIKNTGLADAYIRVSLYGAWVVDEVVDGQTTQLIVSDWKTEDGEFTWTDAGEPKVGIVNNDQWTIGDDGYYYYLNKTVPGETIPSPFESYKLTASPPVSGAYLELYVLAQAIYYDDVTYLFPSSLYTSINL